MSDTKEIGCEEALNRLFDFIDHELDSARHAEVERHLHTCRACYSRAEFEQRLKRKLTESGWEPHPPSLDVRIRKLLGNF